MEERDSKTDKQDVAAKLDDLDAMEQKYGIHFTLIKYFDFEVACLCVSSV
jgi:hypothetical protein